MRNNIYLCKPKGDVIAALDIDEESVSLTEAVADLWELSFDVHRYHYDGERIETPYYDALAEMMELYLVSDSCSARFLIDTEPSVTCDGIAEVKTVTAHSIEAELQYKFLENFQINTGQKVSQENLLKGNLIGEPVDINDPTQELYDYNLNPYTNLPVDYITVSCRLGDDLMAFRSQFQLGETPTSIKWTFDGDTEETEIPIEFNRINGQITGDASLLFKWYNEFTNKYPRMLSDIMWGRDKCIDGEGNQRDTFDTIICVTSAYIALNEEYMGDKKLYVPSPTYDFTLNQAGTEYEITYAPQYSYSFDRFIEGMDKLIDFYEKFGNQLSMLDLILEKAKATDWSVGDIPYELAKKKYSFTVDKQDIYSFLTNTVSHTMKVIIDFDRVDKSVSLIDLSTDDTRFETGIMTGFHTLVQTIDIQSGSTDGIKTTFTPTGANDLGITYVNFGKDKITNLDYFMNKVGKEGEYLYGSAELHDKYAQWKAFREEDLIDIEIPTYEFNLNTKTITSSSVSSNQKTRKQQYIELSKAYNQVLKDINELTYLVPSDGAMTDYTSYNLKELKTVFTAYTNAYATLQELYKTEYQKTEILDEEIINTYFYQDYILYRDTIIPNVINALKIYALTNADGEFLDENGNVTTEYDKFVYPDGGNPQYNGNAELVTESKLEDYLYDMSLYGLSELNVKKKAWAATAAQIFKDVFLKSGIPGDQDPANKAVYRTWDEITAAGMASGFTSQEAYERQLGTYLDYMATDYSDYAVLTGSPDRKNQLTKGETKGVICLAADAIMDCETVIATMTEIQNDIGTLRNDIANEVTYEGWGNFTDKELSILYSLSHEADYANENILTTNLDDVVSTVAVQQELLEDAEKRLFEKSRPQYSFQTSLDNILAIDAFAPLKDQLALLNYFYLKYGLYDDETFKLRIVKMTFNPIIKTEDFSLEFSNMAYTFEGLDDLYYLFEDGMGGGVTSGGGSSSSSGGGGGTYGTNDAEIDISNNMLNALLKNTNTANSLNINNLLTTKQIENLLVKGDLTIDGTAITNVIQSKNFVDEQEEKAGSQLNLEDGTFNFGGGRLIYDGEDLTLQGKLSAKTGEIANFNIYPDELSYTSVAGERKGYYGRETEVQVYPALISVSNVMTYDDPNIVSLNETYVINYSPLNGIVTINVTLAQSEYVDYNATLTTRIYHGETGQYLATARQTVNYNDMTEDADHNRHFSISSAPLPTTTEIQVESVDGIYMGEYGICVGKDNAFTVSCAGDTTITGKFEVNSKHDNNKIYLGNTADDKYVQISPKSIIIANKGSSTCTRITSRGTKTGNFGTLIAEEMLEEDGTDSSGTSNWLKPFNYTANSNTKTITALSMKSASRSTLTTASLYSCAYVQNQLYQVKITNCHQLFKDCTKLVSLDLTYFDTSSVTTMEDMFAGCLELISLELSTFNTSHVTSFARMFQGCSKLTTLTLGNWNTSNATDMSGMFQQCLALNELDVSSFNTAKVTKMNDMFRACAAPSLDLRSFSFVKVTTIANMFTACEASGIILPINISAPNLTTAAQMFMACKAESLTISGFSAPALTNIAEMFRDCIHLQSLIMTNISMPLVTSLNSMLSGCTNLLSVDLRAWDVSKITTMVGLFYNCNHLESVNVLNWNTSKVTDMQYMFYNCSSLTKLDLSSFNTNKVTNIDSMFNGCTHLQYIYVGDDWDIQRRAEAGAIISGNDTFYRCNQLIGIAWDTYWINQCSGGSSSYDEMYAGDAGTGYMTNRPKIKPVLDALDELGKDSDGDCPWIKKWVVDDSIGDAYQLYVENPITNAGAVSLHNYTWYHNKIYEIHVSRLSFNSISGLTAVDLSDFDVDLTYPSGGTTDYKTEYAHLFASCPDLRSIVLGNFFKSSTKKQISFIDTFYELTSLTSVDVENIDTSAATDLTNMFYKCSALTSLNLSNFNTSNVTCMDTMFFYCSGLTSLDISSFDFTKVESLWLMLRGCSSVATLTIGTMYAPRLTELTNFLQGMSSLTTLNVTKFNLPNVTSLQSFCWQCTSLPSFDFSKITAPNLTDISYFFQACSSLVSADLRPLKDHTITDIRYLFNGCTSLTTANFTGCTWQFGVAEPYGLMRVFTGCSALQSLDLRSFDVSNLTRMDDMFEDCSSLTSIDISTWDTSNVENFNDMFHGCASLTTLDLSNFNVNNAYMFQSMFSGCQNLVTIYASYNWSYEIDNVSSTNMFWDCVSIVGESGVTYDDTYSDWFDFHMANYNAGYFTYKAAN